MSENCGLGKQGHAPCRILSLHQCLFFLLVKFHGDCRTVTKMVKMWPPSVLWILPNLKQWCLSVVHFWLITQSYVPGTYISKHYIYPADSVRWFCDVIAVWMLGRYE